MLSKHQKKICSVLVFCFLTLTSLFAVSPKSEHYYVQNDLESSISITGVFQQTHSDSWWIQSVQDFQVQVTEYFPENGVKTCKGKKRWAVIDYFPTSSLMSDEFGVTRKYLLSQPVSAKMRDIFARFEVYDENGRLLFDLDSLEKVHIEIEKEDRIIFVVGDYLYD